MNAEVGSFYERLKKNLGKDDKNLATISSSGSKLHADLGTPAKSEGKHEHFGSEVTTVALKILT